MSKCHPALKNPHAKPTHALSTLVGSVIVALLLLVVGCTGSPTLPAVGDGTTSPFTFKLRVLHHVDQPFRESNVSFALGTGSALLQQRDLECPDVACPCTLELDGDVGEFGAADAIVTSEAQLNALFDVDGDIKVVTAMVGVCGAPATSDMTILLGCSYTSGSVVIVHNAPPDVWVHEWGHVQGLPHRDNCKRNIMHSFELETNAVNSNECEAFTTPTPGTSALRLIPLESDEAVSFDALARGTAETVAEWLERIASREYLAGLPAGCMTSAAPEETADALLEIMSARPDFRWNVNAIRALGLTGDARGCGILEDNVRSCVGTITDAEFRMLAESLLALGRLSAADDTGSALAVLTAGTDPETWAQGAVALQMADGQMRPLADALARICVMALSLSDVPQAGEHLELMQQQLAASRSADPWMADQLAEALSRIRGDMTALRAIDSPRHPLP